MRDVGIAKQIGHIKSFGTCSGFQSVGGGSSTREDSIVFQNFVYYLLLY